MNCRPNTHERSVQVVSEPGTRPRSPLPMRPVPRWAVVHSPYTVTNPLFATRRTTHNVRPSIPPRRYAACSSRWASTIGSLTGPAPNRWLDQFARLSNPAGSHATKARRIATPTIDRSGERTEIGRLAFCADPPRSLTRRQPPGRLDLGKDRGLIARHLRVQVVRYSFSTLANGFWRRAPP